MGFYGNNVRIFRAYRMHNITFIMTPPLPDAEVYSAPHPHTHTAA